MGKGRKRKQKVVQHLRQLQKRMKNIQNKKQRIYPQLNLMKLRMILLMKNLVLQYHVKMNHLEQVYQVIINYHQLMVIQLKLIVYVQKEKYCLMMMEKSESSDNAEIVDE